MGTLFSPTQQDVERYRRLRALGTQVSQKIVNTIPRTVFEEIGDAIGIRRNGVLVFDTEDVNSVLMDCCLYDWVENGENLVQRYAKTHPAQPGTDESYLLQAYQQAQYRVLVVQSAVPGAGLHCEDILNGGELFLMDLACSYTMQNGDAALATRTVPLGEYWMTTGAGLPITPEIALLNAVRGVEGKTLRSNLTGPGELPLFIVRGCLAAGAAELVRYDLTTEKSGAPPRRSRLPSYKFKRRR